MGLMEGSGQGAGRIISGSATEIRRTYATCCEDMPMLDPKRKLTVPTLYGGEATIYFSSKGSLVCVPASLS